MPWPMASPAKPHQYKATPAAIPHLHGHTLRGSGSGVGIHVIDGGDGGAAILGPGGIDGFGIGVLAPSGGLARAVNVTVTGNAADGVRVGGIGFALLGCEA